MYELNSGIWGCFKVSLVWHANLVKIAMENVFNINKLVV